MQEEIKLAREGKIKYEPDPPYVIIRDPKNFQKRMDKLHRLNGLPLKKYDLDALQAESKSGTQVRSSKSVHITPAKKAVHAKKHVSQFVDKLAKK